MKKWLATASKGTIVAVVLSAGILLIVLSDPPHTLCDSQISLFKENQKGVLFLDPSNKVIKTSKIEKAETQCKAGNSPGACYELFFSLKLLLRDIENAPNECVGKIVALKEVSGALWRSVDLMVRLGWGEKPPETYYEKFNWLDSSDISLFCRLRDMMKRAGQSTRWDQQREQTFEKLPGAANLNREKKWEKSIYSLNCNMFPY